MNSQRYRHCFLSELEWLLVPAVATGQFLVSHGRDKASGLSVPTAAVLWASVSAEVDKRLAASGGAPRLKPSEWRSGNIPWLMDVIGDQASGASLVKRLAEGGAGKGGLRCMDRLPDGRAIVRVLGAAAGAREPAAV
jgi:hemolysin-activating ACP:hemolysin acyltransferase